MVNDFNYEEDPACVNMSCSCDKPKRSIIKTIFYDANGVFSTTKTMNVIFFVLAIGLAITGMIAKLVFNKSLDHDTYIYVGGLVGGSFLQYSFGKKLQNGNSNGNGNK